MGYFLYWVQLHPFRYPSYFTPYIWTKYKLRNQPEEQFFKKWILVEFWWWAFCPWCSSFLLAMVGELTAIFLFAELLRFFSSHSSTIPFLTFTFLMKNLIFVLLQQSRLSKAAADAVQELLPESANGDLASVCIWADRIKFRYHWSSALHFIDTPDSLCTYQFDSWVTSSVSIPLCSLFLFLWAFSPDSKICNFESLKGTAKTKLERKDSALQAPLTTILPSF